MILSDRDIKKAIEAGKDDNKKSPTAWLDGAFALAEKQGIVAPTQQ